MKIGIVSDIHSNLHAFEAVLQELGRQGVQEIWNLGDTVGYHAHPQECLQLARKAHGLNLLGNHDWAALHGAPDRFNPVARAGILHTRASLGDAERQYLAELQPDAERVEGDVQYHLAHASLDNPLTTYVFPSHAPALVDRFHRSMSADRAHVILLGHTHQPMLASTRPVDAEGHGELPAANAYGSLFTRDHPILLVNPGSVGQPRDHDPRAAYAVLETETLHVTFHRVTYDVEAAANSLLRAGLPTILADRLRTGR